MVIIIPKLAERPRSGKLCQADGDRSDVEVAVSTDAR